jgi:peptide/nickel transport system permease protein
MSQVANPALLQAAISNAFVEPEKVKVRKTGRISVAISIVWLAFITLCAILGDLLPFISDPQKRDARNIKKPPSMDHWFGTNKIGQDLFSRTMYGGRISLSIAAGAVILGLAVATVLGLAAGYFGGWWDSVISTIMDILLAYPALVLLLAITTFLGHSATWVTLSLAFLSVPPLVRIVRASTMAYANREFVTAARSLGASNKRIIFREILPNVVPTMVSTLLTTMAVLIIAEGALAFLGQSVEVQVPTWGKLILDGYQQLEKFWWLSILPALTLFFTILAFNVIGDQLSKRFDIKESLA